jgi:hypothetical protein
MGTCTTSEIVEPATPQQVALAFVRETLQLPITRIVLEPGTTTRGTSISRLLFKFTDGPDVRIASNQIWTRHRALPIFFAARPEGIPFLSFDEWDRLA